MSGSSLFPFPFCVAGWVFLLLLPFPLPSSCEACLLFSEGPFHLPALRREGEPFTGQEVPQGSDARRAECSSYDGNSHLRLSLIPSSFMKPLQQYHET